MSHAIRYFKALSDETRLRLAHVLGRYELSVNELVSLLEMGQSRVSRHLKILTEAGLLQSRRDGLWVFYSAVNEGEGHAFLKAAEPFVTAEARMRADLDMAARILEDRALKTRQFFNAIADHWDTLSREVLGGFDLAGAVRDAMPPDCGVAVDLGCGTGLVLERMRERARKVIGVDGSPRMLELARRRFIPEGSAEAWSDGGAPFPAAGADIPAGSPALAPLSLRIGELDHLPLRDGEADFASITICPIRLPPWWKSNASCARAGCSWSRILTGTPRSGCDVTTAIAGSVLTARRSKPCCCRPGLFPNPAAHAPWSRVLP